LPHYNSVFNYLESEALTPYLNELITLSAAPLKSIESDFAVDSSGFSTGQFMRWLDVKYGTKEDRRQWLKLHLMVGVKTNIVTSVQVSDEYAHDYSSFKGLVDKTVASGFQMKEVSADKGYLGASNMLATLQHGAIPYIRSKQTRFQTHADRMVLNQNCGPRCITSMPYIARSFWSTITSGPT
jgi:DDE family transposase